MALDRRQAKFPNPGLFSTARAAWLALALYTALLYSTLNLTYDLYVAVFDRIGREQMSLLVNSAYAAVGMAMLVILVKRVPRSLGAYSAFLVIVATAALFLRSESVPANRIHFIQYGPLAALAWQVHQFRWRGLRLQATSLGTVLAVGCGDELLQSLLSTRHFDPHDVLLNMVAGVLGLAFVGLVSGAERSQTDAA